MQHGMPPEVSEWVRQTHARGCDLLRRSEIEPESLAAALAIEEHRWFWKPPKVRLVLIAESHTRTSEQDLAVQIDLEKLIPLLKEGAPMPPSCFVGLVYCLGYGEPELLLGCHDDRLRRRNTVQFWNLFGKITDRNRQPTKSAGSSLEERLAWKIETLRALYRCGIWLMDASLHAIYAPGANRLDLQIKSELHRQWWKGYGQRVIDGLCNPDVWVIGKTTYDTLSALSGWNWPNQWIYQPNAYGVDKETNWTELRRSIQRLVAPIGKT